MLKSPALLIAIQVALLLLSVPCRGQDKAAENKSAGAAETSTQTGQAAKPADQPTGNPTTVVAPSSTPTLAPEPNGQHAAEPSGKVNTGPTAQSGAPAKTQPSPAATALRQTEFDKGNLAFRAKNYAQALAGFRRAAESGADDGNSRIMIGYCSYELHRYSDALREYNRAAKEGTLISVRNKAQDLARRLDLCMRGICPGNCLKPSTPG